MKKRFNTFFIIFPRWYNLHITTHYCILRKYKGKITIGCVSEADFISTGNQKRHGEGNYIHRYIQMGVRTLQILKLDNRPKRRHLKSPRFLEVSSDWRSHSGCASHPIDSHTFRSGLPFPRYNLNLKIQWQGARSKVPSLVSAASSWLISLVFHVRASYRLLPFSFHHNRASHSRDTIWPWKFKVKVKFKYAQVSVEPSWLI